MTLLYNLGLTTGSLMAYFLESILNPTDSIDFHPCHDIQTKILNFSNFTNVTTMRSTPATVISLISTLSTGIDNSTEVSR